MEGQVLLFRPMAPAWQVGPDVWMVSLERDRKPKPLVRTRFVETQPALSPNGRWLAYTSNSSGRNEVYVQPFPDLSAKWQISADGGNEP